MKRVLNILMFCFFCLTMLAQKDVTTFLGFPVDNSKNEMINNLKSKGFLYHSEMDNEYLTGRFNGNDVELFIATNNNKVSRIMVRDAHTLTPSDIKIRFNNLCNQFFTNGKYICLDDYTISDEEDIAYEMVVNHKRYQASFYQLPTGVALDSLNKNITKALLSKYNLEDFDKDEEELKSQITTDYLTALYEAIKHKAVWFMISQQYGRYYILMFYDNELNRVNGEDL